MVRKLFVIEAIIPELFHFYITREYKEGSPVYLYMETLYYFSNKMTEACKWIDYAEAEGFLIGFLENAKKSITCAFTVKTIYQTTN
jgi:hypothetical protein